MIPDSGYGEGEVEESAEAPTSIKLEYFRAHGRALALRMILWYCKQNYDDEFVDHDQFVANKAAGKYRGGQLPVLFLPDGE